MKKINFAFFLLLVYFGIPYIFDYLALLLGKTAGYVENFSRNGILSFALIFLFVYFNKDILEKIKSKENFLINSIFGICSVLLFALNFYFTYCLNQQAYFDYATFIIIGNILIYILASILLFVALLGFNFTKNIFSKFKNMIISLFVFTLLFMQLGLLFEKLWTYFSYVVSASASFMLSFIYPKAGFFLTKTGVPSMFVQDFGATIGASCSGIESLLLFIFLFATVCFFDLEKTKIFFRKHKMRFILTLVFGLIGIFLTNVLRVFIILIVGVYNPKLAFSLFHDNLGWIIFLLYFFMFYRFIWLPNLENNKKI
jgi:exosortase/archaeosortase family protein